MMTRLFVLLTISASFALSAPAYSADPRVTVLAPATPWNLDAADAGCTLRRTFRGSEGPVVLEMVRFAPGDRFELKIIGKFVDDIGDRMTVQYGRLPAQPAPKLMKGTTTLPGEPPVGMVFTSSSLAPAMDYSGIVLVTPEMEGQADQISLTYRSNKAVLQTGSLSKPFAAMRQCTDALVSSWGLNAAQQAKLTRRVQAVNQKVWAREIQKVYPMDQARRGQQGRVNVRLIVGPDGKPTDCKVLKSYNEPAFDKIACEKLMQHGQFVPALDASGSPVSSYFATSILWIIG